MRDAAPPRGFCEKITGFYLERAKKHGPDQKSDAKPLFSQSPYRVGSGPLGP